ncbi:shikimate dehydrogenase family protein [Blattabacterium cuenoti]|uniref:shikimate dehydrogenase family protein n=1 Tax=Blattabacterium cuenoti TaxID=1653831 RepID=UPI00163C9D35|nr:shikimate dehydrogenase [Blattabacterium cuenoti]
MKTKNLFGLVGKNIFYSFSKKFFITKFHRESINDANYEIFDIDNIEQISYILKIPNLKGFNVTIPYKTKIIPFLHDMSKESAHIGSVNVVKITKIKNTKHLIGYNTDIIGFERSFKEDIKKIKCQNNNNLRALILGTGGVSLSVSFVLNKLHIPHKFISRNSNNNNYLLYENINKKLLNMYKIIINCTPIGTYPLIKYCPKLPYQYLTDTHYLYDLIYNPTETLFLKQGKKYNAITRNGLKMLHIQAEESWKIWMDDVVIVKNKQ